MVSISNGGDAKHAHHAWLPIRRPARTMQEQNPFLFVSSNRITLVTVLCQVFRASPLGLPPYCSVVISTDCKQPLPS